MGLTLVSIILTGIDTRVIGTKTYGMVGFYLTVIKGMELTFIIMMKVFIKDSGRMIYVMVFKCHLFVIIGYF